MDTLITAMVMFAGGLLAIALAIAGWEAMQRTITEQLAREAYAANADALERPFLSSEPGRAVAPETAHSRPPPLPEAQARRQLVQHTLEHAARPEPSLTRAAPRPGPNLAAWPDTIPMSTLTLGPTELDAQAIESARRAQDPNATESVVTQRSRALDVELH